MPRTDDAVFRAQRANDNAADAMSEESWLRIGRAIEAAADGDVSLMVALPDYLLVGLACFAQTEWCRADLERGRRRAASN